MKGEPEGRRNKEEGGRNNDKSGRVRDPEKAVEDNGQMHVCSLGAAYHDDDVVQHDALINMYRKPS